MLLVDADSFNNRQPPSCLPDNGRGTPPLPLVRAQLCLQQEGVLPPKGKGSPNPRMALPHACPFRVGKQNFPPRVNVAAWLFASPPTHLSIPPEK